MPAPGVLSGAASAVAGCATAEHAAAETRTATRGRSWRGSAMAWAAAGQLASDRGILNSRARVLLRVWEGGLNSQHHRRSDGPTVHQASTSYILASRCDLFSKKIWDSTDPHA